MDEVVYNANMTVSRLGHVGIITIVCICCLALKSIELIFRGLK